MTNLLMILINLFALNRNQSKMGVDLGKIWNIAESSYKKKSLNRKGTLVCLKMLYFVKPINYQTTLSYSNYLRLNSKLNFLF